MGGIVPARPPLVALVALPAVLTVLVTVLVVLAGARPAAAQTERDGRLVLSEDGVWRYAEALFADGEYYRAISEYKRLVHFFPDGRRVPAARLRIGEAYINGGEPGRAEAHLSGLLADPGPLRAEALFLRGVARLELDAHAPYPLREPHIAAALDDLRAVPESWRGRERAAGFVAALEHPPELPDKSPWLAAGLSALLPGAGSAYVGRYAEGTLAFFVNGVFIYATVDAFREERRGLGAVLGAAALTFYGGAIYAAANGAHKFNDDARAEYLAGQRRRFGLVPNPDGIVVRMQQRF